MKTRILSAIVVLLIAIPLILKGGILYSLFIYVLSLSALYELIKLKSKKKEMPSFISFISYIMMTLLVFSSTASSMNYEISYSMISGLFLVFTVPAVLYHDRSKYSIVDAFYMIGSIFFLGISFSYLITIRNSNLNIFIYLLLITIITDTYAYFTGSLIGKHKLIESVSPNKTIEGFVGGTIMGTFIPSLFFYTLMPIQLPLYVIIFITFFLSVIGQLGDLFFSAIKRYYGEKDFAKLIPGHGGILDRLDSIIFVLLGFMFFTSVL